MRVSLAVVVLFAPSIAWADVDPKCAGLSKPADYDEQVQQDFQQNYFALATSYSPGHAAIPHQPGHGAVGLQASLMPPLGCEQRFVLDWSKTEDPNKSPVVGRIFASYAFPAIKKIVVPYASFGFLPTFPINGTRNLLVSGELGLGVHAHQYVDVGARFHASLLRSYGDYATAFDTKTQPVVEDVYMGSTWGADVLISAPIEVKKATISPFVSVGYTNASTFFFVGDDSFAGSNLHPYSGAAISAGLDTLIVKHVRLGVEFYGAPGGYSLPDKTVTSVDQDARYGHLYTARGRLGYEF
jgi:hypothetical protein